MRIACPACSAAYDVPEDRLRPGRAVRCARCSATWTPVEEPDTLAPLSLDAPPPAPAPDPVTPPMPDPDPRPAPGTGLDPEQPPAPPHDAPTASPARRAGTRPGLALAWLLTVAVLVAAVALAVMRRADIVQAWPPAARLYALLGLVP